MSKKAEWTEAFGKKFAAVSRLYAFLVSTWDRMGIGPEIIDWITTDKGVQAFRKAVESFGADFLEATTPVVEPKPITFADFPVWKTIRRNPDRKTGDDYRKAMESKEDKIGGIANKIIDQISASSGEDVCDLYRLSPRMFGFSQAVTRKEWYDTVLKAGFELAPLWLCTELREEYRDQPMGESLPIGIDPVEINGDLSVFDVSRDGVALWLGAFYGRPGDRWDADDEWVFVRRKYVL